MSVFDRSFLIIPQHVTARKIIPKRWLVSDLGKSLNCFIIFGTNEQRLPQAEPLNPEQKETRNRSENGLRVTESQRYPEVRVGEIFLCQISINSPIRFAHRGIKINDKTAREPSIYIARLLL